jgi:hypothetical protein
MRWVYGLRGLSPGSSGGGGGGGGLARQEYHAVPLGDGARGSKGALRGAAPHARHDAGSDTAGRWELDQEAATLDTALELVDFPSSAAAASNRHHSSSSRR